MGEGWRKGCVEKRQHLITYDGEREELSKSQFLVKNRLDFLDASNFKKLIAGSLELLTSFSWLTLNKTKIIPITSIEKDILTRAMES